MTASKSPNALRSLCILVTIALTVPLAGGVLSRANAESKWTLLQRGEGGPASGPMFGPLGQLITTADRAGPWVPAGRGAYRADISLMSRADPITYKTTFSAPGNVDLADIQAAGIKLVLTVRNSASNNDFPLPGDGSMDAAFQAALGSMIDQLHPDYLVYGNEVNDAAKYAGTVAEFQHLMTLGHVVAAGRGVPDGATALMGSVTSQATYADILATEGSAAAAAFKSAAKMAPVDPALAAKGNAFIDATKAASVDFFVWHSYFGSSSAILSIKEYVEKRFGGPSFINELGWRTGSAATGTAIIDALNATTMPIVLLYGSGEGINAPDKLWDASAAPTTEGSTVSAHLTSLPNGSRAPAGRVEIPRGSAVQASRSAGPSGEVQTSARPSDSKKATSPVRSMSTSSSRRFL